LMTKQIDSNSRHLVSEPNDSEQDYHDSSHHQVVDPVRVDGDSVPQSPHHSLAGGACYDYHSQLPRKWCPCDHRRPHSHSMGGYVCSEIERRPRPDSAVNHNAPCWWRSIPAIVRGHSANNRRTDQTASSSGKKYHHHAHSEGEPETRDNGLNMRIEKHYS
jgi:hypothetical protein